MSQLETFFDQVRGTNSIEQQQQQQILTAPAAG